jgi:hypothetical protein
MCIAFFEVARAKKAESPDDLKPPPPGFMVRQLLESRLRELLPERLRKGRK